LAARPDDVGLVEFREGRERAADRLLAHPAMAERRFRLGQQGVADGAALAAAGHHGLAFGHLESSDGWVGNKFPKITIQCVFG
jgi:hypothetical protein